MKKKSFDNQENFSIKAAKGKEGFLLRSNFFFYKKKKFLILKYTSFLMLWDVFFQIPGPF